MASLPLELWDQIAAEVYATDNMGALVAMCSSSQLLQDAAYPRLYKHVCLDVNDIHQVIGFMSGIASHKSRHVRALTIAPSSYVTGTTPSRMLERIVRSLRNLRLFRWQSSIPIGEPLLKVLNNCQNILELRMHHRLGRASEKKLPTSALSTSKLSSLSLHVEWHYSTNGNPNFQPCQMAILNTPNLIALSIHIQYTGKGQSGKVAILEFSTQRLLPPLEFLTLSGYAIGLGRPDELEHRIQVPALRVLNLTPGLGSNLFNFLATLMRSKQLRLEVVGIDGRALVFPSPVLHSWPAVFEAFLKHFKGLKELALKGAFVLPLPSLPVAEGISCHGETLEILILHHAVLVRGLPFQAFRRYRPRPIDVKNLCDTCPHLRKLTVDLHFGDNLALQRSFQHFQTLEMLTIYSPLRREGKNFLEPRVDLRYVYALAVQLRSPRLRKCTIYVGLEAIPTQYDFNEDIKWESEHRMVWEIEYPEDDDSYAGIKVWESLHQEQGRIEEVQG